jgi:HAMP domain-containing protein
MMAKKADQESSMMAKRSQHEMSAQKSSIEPLVQAQMQQTEVVAGGMQAMAGGINEMAGSIGQLAQAITQRDALPPPGHEDMLKAITKLGRKPKGARKMSDGAFMLEYDD